MLLVVEDLVELQVLLVEEEEEQEDIELALLLQHLFLKLIQLQ